MRSTLNAAHPLAVVMCTLTLLIGSGCDDGSTGTGGNGGNGGAGGGDAASHGEAYATALCDNTFNCCNTADLAEVFKGLNAVVDYAGCHIFYRTVWDAAIETQIADSKAKGRLDFNETAFNECLQYLAERACGEPVNAPEACSNMFGGKVDNGGACASQFECKSANCVIDNGQTEGSCADAPTPSVQGGACAEDQPCDTGLYCKAGQCAPKELDGVTCQSNNECKSGTCAGAGPGTCKTICSGGGPGPGPVDADLDGIGAAIVDAECDKIFNCCTADERDTKLFAGTDTKIECSTLLGVFMSQGLVTLHNSKVQGKTTINGTALADCINSYAAASCGDYAKGTGFQCESAILGQGALGTTCAGDHECESSFCDPSQGETATCNTLPGANEACAGTCAKGLYCDGGTCIPQKAVGTNCNGTNECLEGECYSDGSAPTTCTLICNGI